MKGFITQLPIHLTSFSYGLTFFKISGFPFLTRTYPIKDPFNEFIDSLDEKIKKKTSFRRELMTYCWHKINAQRIRQGSVSIKYFDIFFVFQFILSK